MSGLKGAGPAASARLPAPPIRPAPRAPTQLRTRLALAMVVTTLGLLWLPHAAFAEGELVIPAGDTAHLTNVKFNSCNEESFGYQLNGGSGNELASSPGECKEHSAANATLGPFATEQRLTFYLDDETCGYIFPSTERAHARVGGSPTVVKLYDAGGFCEYPPGEETPGAKEESSANLEATVEILSPPAAPEYLHCIAHKYGEYSTPNCATKAAKHGKGSYELAPPGCTAVKKGFYSNSDCTTRDEKKGKPKGKFELESDTFTSSASSVVLGEVSGRPRLTCGKYVDRGEVVGPRSGIIHQEFSECSTEYGGCQNASAGVITSSLDTVLIGHGEKGPAGEEPAAGEVWTEFVSPSGTGGYSYQFACNGLTPSVRVRGSTSGLTSGDVNVLSTTSTLEFRPGVGEQALLTEISNGSFYEGPYSTRNELITTSTFAQPLMIKD